MLHTVYIQYVSTDTYNISYNVYIYILLYINLYRSYIYCISYVEIVQAIVRCVHPEMKHLIAKNPHRACLKTPHTNV